MYPYRTLDDPICKDMHNDVYFQAQLFIVLAHIITYQVAVAIIAPDIANVDPDLYRHMASLGHNELGYNGWNFH